MPPFTRSMAKAGKSLALLRPVSAATELTTPPPTRAPTVCPPAPKKTLAGIVKERRNEYLRKRGAELRKMFNVQEKKENQELTSMSIFINRPISLLGIDRTDVLAAKVDVPKNQLPSIRSSLQALSPRFHDLTKEELITEIKTILPTTTLEFIPYSNPKNPSLYHIPHVTFNYYYY